MKEGSEDLQVVVTDHFDLLAFETDCELVFSYARATAQEVAARVAEACHETGRAAQVRCAVRDNLICARLAEMRLLRISEWQPSEPEVEFRSDDIIILVGRDWNTRRDRVGRDGFRVVFGVAEIEVSLPLKVERPARRVPVVESELVS